MADNVAITAGTGTTIAADDVGGGVLHQRVKVTWGPDGTGNDADVASGKPLPIQLRVSDGTAWTYGSGALGAGTPRVTLATDSPGVVTLGQTTMAASLPVAVASNQTAIPTKSNAAGTGTMSQVASSATAVTILAANTARLGATVFNDSTAILYLGISTTTPTSGLYSIKMAAGSYAEVPFGYTGNVKGIWASANGNAQVTEMT